MIILIQDAVSWYQDPIILFLQTSNGFSWRQDYSSQTKTEILRDDYFLIRVSTLRSGSQSRHSRPLCKSNRPKHSPRLISPILWRKRTYKKTSQWQTMNIQHLKWTWRYLKTQKCQCILNLSLVTVGPAYLPIHTFHFRPYFVLGCMVNGRKEGFIRPWRGNECLEL